MSFEELSSKLQAKPAMLAAGDMLHRIIHLCNWKQGGSQPIAGRVDILTFVGCYRIAAHPLQVLHQTDGTLEKNVIAASEALLDCVEAMAEAIASGREWLCIRQALPTRMVDYLHAFKVKSQSHSHEKIFIVSPCISSSNPHDCFALHQQQRPRLYPD